MQNQYLNMPHPRSFSFAAQIKRFASILLCTFLLMTSIALGQTAKLGRYRVDPPNWWVGMQNTKLDLILMGDRIAAKQVKIDYPGVKLLGVDHGEEERYLFIHLDVAGAAAGTFNIVLTEGKSQEYVPYVLRPRAADAMRKRGIDGSDVIYLIMPDRFANGDPANDELKSLNQVGINRDSILQRHGGDLKGISNHLDYIADLGMTALWLNPVQENNEPKESYHGYAITDHYRVDPRLGDNESYRHLVEKCHAKGLKMIMDMVYNHWGDKHYLNQRLPSLDWVHQQKEFQRTSYRANTLIDPHVAKGDLRIFTDGWFDRHMPDLNQQNLQLASYLIQNSIWWIEYANLDAFRIDTWLYSDATFMRNLLEAIFKEYPSFGVFGETWVQGVALQAFVTKNHLDIKPAANLPGVTDFQLYDAINEALTKKMGWTEGVSRMYQTLAEDYLYADPQQNVIFLDNHDLSRYYSMVGEDLRKFKMGVAWLATMRGIPQVFYGTEILMKSWANPDARVRIDFPGGWQGDTQDKFQAAGRSTDENEAFDYMRSLLKWRRSKSCFRDGKLIHFVPADGIYVYFRMDAASRVMVVMNCNDTGKLLKLDRFAECLQGVRRFQEATSGNEMAFGNELKIAPWTTLVLDLLP
jgi:neopullulanase